MELGIVGRKYKRGEIMENIIITGLTVLIPSLTTIYTNKVTKKENRMHNAKQSIFQLILEDHVRVAEGRLPENYQEVCKEYDIYTKNGGNSYVKKKVEAYYNWYDKIKKD
jgi:hypothetical protein